MRSKVGATLQDERVQRPELPTERTERSEERGEGQGHEVLVINSAFSLSGDTLYTYNLFLQINSGSYECRHVCVCM